jgi:hypothetical protein
MLEIYRGKWNEDLETFKLVHSSKSYVFTDIIKV